MAQSRQTLAAAGGSQHPHSVSLKVLRLSKPTLVPAVDVPGPGILNTASKPYPSTSRSSYSLTPLLQLPPAFGAAYVGTTFSCTLCANNELPESSPIIIRDVEITAELQSPGGVIPLDLSDQYADVNTAVLESGRTVQKIIRQELREDGQHVLAVMVTYTEVPSEQQGDASEEDAGNKRTFRKLYQFTAQPAVGVRTKIGELKRNTSGSRKFVLEAQLENLTEGSIVLDAVSLNLAKALTSKSLNRDSDGTDEKNTPHKKPCMAPEDVMQVAFVIDQVDGKTLEEKRDRIVLAQVHLEWNGPMGEKGELTTGWLGCKGR
ncbi:hypothetical protein AAFC00_002599 [Neodothiora populina]|uniref:DUF974 domain protein n=1 Tax=Neodothiora populina TaxID=2781224 RepID=A0ABR3P8C3_9PEZI